MDLLWIITVGNQLFTEQKRKKGQLILFCADMLTDQINTQFPCKLSTIRKECKKGTQTFSSLRCDGQQKFMVCQVNGTRHAENSKRIEVKNVSTAWIVGTACQKLNMISHAGSDQGTRAEHSRL